jgi:hypothetical protein
MSGDRGQRTWKSECGPEGMGKYLISDFGMENGKIRVDDKIKNGYLT